MIGFPISKRFNGKQPGFIPVSFIIILNPQRRDPVNASVYQSGSSRAYKHIFIVP